MKTLVLLLAALSYLTPASATTPQIVGKGCTTAFYIDQDCDGHGTGMKASGTYTIGLNGNVQSSPLIETMGDLTDADDMDATVWTTAQWEAKWGVGNVGLRAWLPVRKGFTNHSRIWYLSATGNDATALVNRIDLPFKTMDAILTLAHDFQGGVIVTRGGNYSDWALATNGGSRQASGSSGKLLCVMAYPGERVEITATYAVFINGTYAPGRQVGYIYMFGLIFKTPTFGDGNIIDSAGFIDTTIEDCEFAGAHQLSFADHTVNLTFRRNVGHQFLTHFFYLMSSTYPIYFGEADFPFDQEQLRWANSGGLGVAENITVEENVAYNDGYSGYEPWHMNTNARYIHFRNNITSYSGGMGIGLQTGIYDSEVIGNVFFDSADSCVLMYTYELVGAAVTPSKIRRILIENNTCYVSQSISGGSQVRIRGDGLSGCFVANDATQQVQSPTDEHPILDITIRNNSCVYDNWSVFSGPAAFDMRKHSHPETWIIENNQFWSSNSGSSPSTAVVMRISPDTTAGDGVSTRYTFAQTQAFGWSSISGNIYADPQHVAANKTWTLTPELYNLRPTASSPLRGAASSTSAPTTDITGAPWTGTIGAYQYVSAAVGGMRTSGRAVRSGRAQ